ncbi:MAG: lipopolysaccharide transport periplasmic protein LptA [Sulfuricaulis sp.]
MTARTGISHPVVFAITLAISVLTATAVHAAKKDADEPMHIKARSVEANEKTGVSVYRGSVRIDRGPLSIEADRVEMHARDNKTELIRATGAPAKLRRQAEAGEEEIQAEAERIDYHVADGKLDMSGKVSLRRGKDLFTGATLHYDLNTKSLNAAGGGGPGDGVHVVIQARQHSTETVPPP